MRPMAPAKQNMLFTQPAKRKLNTQIRLINLLAAAIEPNQNSAPQRRLTTLDLRLQKLQSIDLERRDQTWCKMLYPSKSLPQNSSMQSGWVCSTQYKIAAARDISLFVGCLKNVGRLLWNLFY